MIRINTAIKESTLARPQADLAESTSGGDGGRSPTITDGTPSVWNFRDFRRASVCRAGSVTQPRRSRRPRPTTRVLSAFVRESGQRRTPGVVDGGEADARARMLPVGFVAKQSIRLWIDPMNQTAAAALTHCAKCLATPCDCSETGASGPGFFLGLPPFGSAPLALVASMISPSRRSARSCLRRKPTAGSIRPPRSRPPTSRRWP